MKNKQGEKIIFTKRVAFFREENRTDFGIMFDNRFFATTINDGETLNETAQKLIDLGNRLLREMVDL